MATTGQNFAVTGGTSTVLAGTTVSTNPIAVGADPISIQEYGNAAGPSGSGVQTSTNNSATIIDRVFWDLAAGSTTVRVGEQVYMMGMKIGGFAKNGMIYITFTGTTTVTLDLTAISAAIGVTSSQAGDTSLGTLNCLIIRNLSATASTITVAPGGSNPAPFPNAFAGTTPSKALLLGDCMCEYAVIGKTIDSTHKNILFTPTAGGALAIAYGGA